MKIELEGTKSCLGFKSMQSRTAKMLPKGIAARALCMLAISNLVTKKRQGSLPPHALA